MLDSSKPLHGRRPAYIRFPLHGCPLIKNVFGIAPSPASVNVPKSLHHSTRGTSGFVLIQFVSRIMSSSVIDRSLTRSSRCPRTAFVILSSRYTARVSRYTRSEERRGREVGRS